MRKPRFNEATDLVAYWSPREQDVMYHFPRRSDGHMLHGALTYAKVVGDATFLKELERRGYDLTTLRFSISLKAPPREPHATAVEACPHSCVGACSLCPSPTPTKEK